MFEQRRCAPVLGGAAGVLPLALVCPPALLACLTGLLVALGYTLLGLLPRGLAALGGRTILRFLRLVAHAFFLTAPRFFGPHRGWEHDARQWLPLHKTSGASGLDWRATLVGGEF
jgi:hypothetical protein